MGSTDKIIAGIQKGLDMSVSGAMHTTISNLQSPIDKLANSFDRFTNELNKSTEKTQTLTKWLIFWTGIMALAVIGQIIAIIWSSIN